MKITIYSFGKSKHKFLLQGEAEYLKRLTTEGKFQIIELGAAAGALATPDLIRAAEAKMLLTKVKENEFLLVLDEGGQKVSSPQLAELLKKSFDRGISSISFAIGGPEGWDKSVTERANICLSLSSLTFTAQMARFILIEQLYRALCIVRGKPYHR